MHNKFLTSQIQDCTIHRFNVIGGDDYIIPISFKDSPFQVKRIFTVVDGDKNLRGMHAHKECNQLLICIAGELEVFIYDGFAGSSYYLQKGMGIFIPIGIWSEQRYLKSQTVLNVLCDMEYVEEEYIRNYETFKELKK